MGVTAPLFTDLKSERAGRVKADGKRLGGSAEACGPACLLELFTAHGSDYKPEAAQPFGGKRKGAQGFPSGAFMSLLGVAAQWPSRQPHCPDELL